MEILSSIQDYAKTISENQLVVGTANKLASMEISQFINNSGYYDSASDINTDYILTINVGNANISTVNIQSGIVTAEIRVNNKPLNETEATLIVNVSSYTESSVYCTPGWYTFELKGAGGGNSTSGGDAGYGGYIKERVYIVYPITVNYVCGNAGAAAQGGGSTVVWNYLFEFITGGGGGNNSSVDRGGGYDCPGYNFIAYSSGDGGRIPTYTVHYKTAYSTIGGPGQDGKNNLNEIAGGGSSPDTAGTIKIWKH